MKTPTSISQTPGPAKARGAFTLPEIMITLAVFGLVVMATVSSQICGMRLFQISDTKLRIATDARQTLNHLRDEIWSSKLVYVGNGSSNSFSFIPDNHPHIGNALRICATTDTNSYVYYFFDTNSACLMRMVGSNSLMTVIARNVTNQFVFSAEDFQGNTLTNYLNNRVIKMDLEMFQPEFFGSVAEYYHLQTRVTQRAIE